MNRYILLSYTVLTNMTETIQVLFCKTNHKCTIWKCYEPFYSKNSIKHNVSFESFQNLPVLAIGC